MQWYNEPAYWEVQGNKITVTTGAKTDFWRKTHSGVIADNGHFYHQQVTGNFTAEVKLQGQYNALYDQAGLMVRLDETRWMKCGIEFLEGSQYASAVVTRDFSDWSVVSLPQNPSALWLRVKREQETLEVHYALDGTQYHLLRQAYLPPDDPVSVGIMCASPTGNGFSVTFEGFQVRTG